MTSSKKPTYNFSIKMLHCFQLPTFLLQASSYTIGGGWILMLIFYQPVQLRSGKYFFKRLILHRNYHGGGKSWDVLLRMRKGVIVGIVCHYTIMPLVGFRLPTSFNFLVKLQPELFWLVVVPADQLLRSMSYPARANLALSVSVTTISTLLAPFLTPLLMGMLGGNFIEIDFWAMVWDITKIVIIPIAGGLLFHYLVHENLVGLIKPYLFFLWPGLH